MAISYAIRKLIRDFIEQVEVWTPIMSIMGSIVIIKLVKVGLTTGEVLGPPEVANIMGYAYRTCRSYFSPMQVAKMYGYIDDIGISHPSFYITGPNYVCTGQSGTLSVPAL